MGKKKVMLVFGTRPEPIDKATFIIAEESLLQAVDTAVELCRYGQHGITVPDYVEENYSTKG